MKWFGFGLCMGLALMSAVVVGEDPPQVKPEEGLAVGQFIPTTTMRQVIGGEDKNTCLAGKYRAHQTFAIYARNLGEPGLAVAAKAVDELLVKNEKARGYVLLLSDKKIDPNLKADVKKWWTDTGLKKIDVAISSNLPDFGDIPETAIVTVIWSDQRIVKYRKSFESGRLGVEAEKELREHLAKLGK